MNVTVFANAYHTLSGGDRIFAECSRRWIENGERVTVVTNEKGAAFCLESNIPTDRIRVWAASSSDRFGVIASSAYKSVTSVLRALFAKPDGAEVVFSSSYFLPDVLPALVARRRNPGSRWIVGFYLIADPPWRGGVPGNFLAALLLWLTQIVAFGFVRRFADGVLTASPVDRAWFVRRGFPPTRVLAIRGGVDVANFNRVPNQPIRFDAVFVGRLHPQKCLPDLLRIWRDVVSAEPQRRLALVGGGSLEPALKKLAAKLGIADSVAFLGILDGEAKVTVLKASRLFVSASRFDSGNIALDEALACRVPGVIYDLPRLEYPQGVVKVPVGDAAAFTTTVQRLLQDDGKWAELSAAGRRFAETLDWSHAAGRLAEFIRASSRRNDPFPT
jgi:glycosyltransferase involved in cell wall biosynthesis